MLAGASFPCLPQTNYITVGYGITGVKRIDHEYRCRAAAAARADRPGALFFQGGGVDRDLAARLVQEHPEHGEGARRTTPRAGPVWRVADRLRPRPGAPCRCDRC